MLVNRAIEAGRRLSRRNRRLAERARGATRRPLILVPPCFGVRLADERGAEVWGATRRIFFGRSFAEVGALRPAGLLDGFGLVPLVYRHDVLGGLVRHLEGVGGYRAGEDLFVLAYDWRAPVRTAAELLGDLVARVRGAADDAVDLVCVSSGGRVARVWLAGAAPGVVRRVVYLGTPQRGSFSAFDYSQQGLSFVPRGRHFGGRELAAGCPSLFETMPHPGETVFVDDGGAPLAHDLYDERTWRELGLIGADLSVLEDRLAAARAVHETIDRGAERHPPSVVIADRHAPTPFRAVVSQGRVVIPCACDAAARRRWPFAFTDGDGSVPASSMAAAPGLGESGPWWVVTGAHHRIATEPHVHPLVLEALLAPAPRVAAGAYPIRITRAEAAGAPTDRRAASAPPPRAG